MVKLAIYGMVYLGSALMVYNICGFIRFARYVRGLKNWTEKNHILQIPIVLLVLFLLGYLAVGILGKPDMIVSLILFGGSIFVFVMYKLLFGITQQIVEKEQLEAKLQVTEASNRAKASFLASISHEMRTPMNVILGLASIALKDPELPPQAREQLEKIGQSGRHLLDMINRILEWNQIEIGALKLKTEEFSVSGALDQVNAIVHTLCQEKGLTYEVSMEGTAFRCLGDEVVAHMANLIRDPDDASTVSMAWPKSSGTLPYRIPIGSALVTRPESFASLSEKNRPSPETLPAWALKDGASPSPFDEDAEDEEPLVPRDFGLHAKVFLWRRTGETNLLLGSMNATHSGLCRNVEMMVRLRCDPRSYSGRDLLEDLFGKEWWKDLEKNGPVNPFEPISAEESLSSDEIQRERDRKTAQDVIFDFCRCDATGRVERDGEWFAFNLSVPDSFQAKQGVRCSIRPLRGGTAAGVAPGNLRFDGFRLADLSDFFVFSAETPSCTVSRIVQLHVDGIEADERDSAALSAVVAETGGWKGHLEILFAEDAVWTAAEQRECHGAGGVTASAEGLPPGLYEKMLRAAARDDAIQSFQDAKALLEGQSDPDADKVRALLDVFLDSLFSGRQKK